MTMTNSRAIPFFCALMACSISTSLWSASVSDEPPPSATADAHGALDEARALALLARSGDLDVLMTLRSNVRAQIEAFIQQQDPKAVTELSAELDVIFATEAVRTGLAESLISHFALGGFEQAEAWSSKPQMMDINLVLAHPEAVEPVDTGSTLTTERRAKLLRLADATALPNRLAAPNDGIYSLAMDVMRAINPELPQNSSSLSNFSPPDKDLLVDRWLGPALARFLDAEIDEFLEFAESEAGYRYFNYVSLEMGFHFGQWRDDLLASIRTHAKVMQPQETESFDALKEKAQHLLRVVNTSSALPEARSLLLRAERLEPDDAEVQTMLGEIATHLRGGSRPSREELRVPEDPGAFVEAERYLRRAIELDPSGARAYALLGRAKFLQGQDEEAEKLFSQVSRLDPEQAWLRVNLADLASVKGQFDKAIELYSEALNLPEKESGVHFWALVRSRIAFRESDRLADYTRLGRQYMQNHPEDKDYPYSFAEHLLQLETEDAQTLQVLEQSSPSRNPTLRNQLMAKALAGMAHASFNENGTLTPQARQWLDRAIELSGGSEADLIDALGYIPIRVEPMVTVVRASKTPSSIAAPALFRALLMNRIDLIEQLAIAGADLNVTLQEFQEQPLTMAMMHRDGAAFKKLLELGADPTLARSQGKSIEQILDESSDDPDIAVFREILRSHQ